jgi:hypothetical protein
MINLGGNFPVGFCTACCERMTNGASYGALSVGATKLVHAYCEHNQAAATLLVRPGMPLRWEILQPIDVLDWPRLLKLRASALEALEGSAAGGTAAVQTSALNEEVTDATRH